MSNTELIDELMLCASGIESEYASVSGVIEDAVFYIKTLEKENQIFKRERENELPVVSTVREIMRNPYRDNHE